MNGVRSDSVSRERKRGRWTIGGLFDTAAATASSSAMQGYSDDSAGDRGGTLVPAAGSEIAGRMTRVARHHAADRTSQPRLLRRIEAKADARQLLPRPPSAALLVCQRHVLRIDADVSGAQQPSHTTLSAGNAVPLASHTPRITAAALIGATATTAPAGGSAAGSYAVDTLSDHLCKLLFGAGMVKQHEPVIVLGCDDGLVHWMPERSPEADGGDTGAPVRVLVRIEDPVVCIRATRMPVAGHDANASPDGLVIVGERGQVVILHADNGRLVRDEHAVFGSVHCCYIGQCGRALISTRDDRTYLLAITMSVPDSAHVAHQAAPVKSMLRMHPVLLPGVCCIAGANDADSAVVVQEHGQVLVLDMLQLAQCAALAGEEPVLESLLATVDSLDEQQHHLAEQSRQLSAQIRAMQPAMQICRGELPPRFECTLSVSVRPHDAFGAPAVLLCRARRLDEGGAARWSLLIRVGDDTEPVVQLYSMTLPPNAPRELNTPAVHAVPLSLADCIGWPPRVVQAWLVYVDAAACAGMEVRRMVLDMFCSLRLPDADRRPDPVLVASANDGVTSGTAAHAPVEDRQVASVAGALFSGNDTRDRLVDAMTRAARNGGVLSVTAADGSPVSLRLASDATALDIESPSLYVRAALRAAARRRCGATVVVTQHEGAMRHDDDAGRACAASTEQAAMLQRLSAMYASSRPCDHQ